MFKELKETMLAWVEEGMMTIAHWIEKINKEIEKRFTEIMDENFQLKEAIILHI